MPPPSSLRLPRSPPQTLTPPVALHAVIQMHIMSHTPLTPSAVLSQDNRVPLRMSAALIQALLVWSSRPSAPALRQYSPARRAPPHQQDSLTTETSEVVISLPVGPSTPACHRRRLQPSVLQCPPHLILSNSSSVATGSVPCGVLYAPPPPMPSSAPFMPLNRFIQKRPHRPLARQPRLDMPKLKPNAPGSAPNRAPRVRCAVAPPDAESCSALCDCR